MTDVVARTVWLTGLPGAGKSTLARALTARLVAAGRRGHVVDGDALRSGLNRDLGYTRADRRESVRRAAEVARVLNEAGVTAVVAHVSPYREDREVAREVVGASRFVLVHVATPLEECRRRDPKALYARAARGELDGLTGVDDPYEGPGADAVVVDTSGRTVDEAVAALLRALDLPAPDGRIAYFRGALGAEEQAEVAGVLASGWLTTGTRVASLERAFGEVVQARHALAVSSCTAALHLALEALGVGPGNRVLVPTLTFTATAEVVRYLGADVVLCDVEDGTGLVTPALVDEALARAPGVKAAIVVHFGGQAADLLGRGGQPGILEVCRRRGVRLVEDAAHAFPARAGAAMVGSIGDATCFSFYANKTLTTGEGGMLTTNDEALARRARVMRLHGIDRDVWTRFTGERPAWEYDVVAPGFKYNLADLNAAVALPQLARAAAERAARERCARVYLARLAGLPLDLPRVHGRFEDHAWHLFPIVLRPDAPLERAQLIERLAAEGIGTSVHYKPLHRMSYWRDRCGARAEDFPAAERWWRGCVSLPIHPSLRDDELERVCAALERALG